MLAKASLESKTSLFLCRLISLWFSATHNLRFLVSAADLSSTFSSEQTQSMLHEQLNELAVQACSSTTTGVLTTSTPLHSV